MLRMPMLFYFKKCYNYSIKGVNDLLKIGDVVVYGAQGICKIDGLDTKTIGKTDIEYYVLKPIFNDNTAVFVPVENATLTAKMQSVLTKTQADELICKTDGIDIIKTISENQKRELYKTVLSSNNREKLISLIKTIRQERDSRRENNKKLNISDEQILRKAEMLLYNELAFVYGVAPEEVKNIINF